MSSLIVCYQLDCHAYLTQSVTRKTCHSWFSVAQVASDRALQLGRALSQYLGQVLQVVTGGDTEFPHKVLGSTLQVSVVFAVVLVLGSTEIGVGGDGRGALEALQAGFGLGLGVRVELALAEELVG